MRVSPFIRRALRATVVPAMLVPAVSSFSVVDSFVANGEYARALELAADCTSNYIPAMNVAPVDAPVARFASLSFEPAGADLRRMYAPVSSPSANVRLASSDEMALAGNEATSTMASYEEDEFAISVTSSMTSNGCVRIYLGTTTPVIPVGMHDGGVTTTPVFRNLTDIKPPAGWNGTVQIPGVNPNAVEGKLSVLVLKNGVPQPNVKVFLSAVGRGDPGRYGATHGHSHLANSTALPMPTLRFNTGQPTRAEFQVITGGDGKYELNIYPGWRGGPETILARAVIDGKNETGARAFVIRHRNFVNFAQALGFNNWPTRGNRFPFLMTGWTAEHNYNHFIQEGIGVSMAETFRTVWTQDPNRVRKVADLKAANPSADPKFWMMLNDMSLEYGGRFDVDASDACTLQTGGGGHATHRAGIDFDISPCYTTSDGQKIGATACESDAKSSRPKYVHIDKRVLTAHVIGRLGGAILAHGSDYDNYLYHYHIRFPQAVPQAN